MAYDRVSAIMAFEGGSASEEEVLELFSDLVKSGMAWSLQGSYGRMAQALIDGGLIDSEGTVNWELLEEEV